jgi:hypothetical protein
MNSADRSKTPTLAERVEPALFNSKIPDSNMVPLVLRRRLVE